MLHSRVKRLLIIFLVITGLNPGLATAVDRPNLLFLLTDDQRADTVGYSGNSAVKTPNIDQLAAEGVAFENTFVVSSICAVSRACILLGQYPRRTGIDDFATPISEDQWSASYPALLRKSSYETGFIGKWGVGSKKPADLDKVVPKFDFWAGFPDQGNFWHDSTCAWLKDGTAACSCPAPEGRQPYESRTGNDGLIDPRHLTTSIIPEKAAEFLAGRDPARPFCLSISFKAPHAPWQDWDPELRNIYNNVEMPLAASVGDPPPDFLRQTLNVTEGQQLLPNSERIAEWTRHYYRLITGIDVAVGKIRESLREHGLESSTVIVFTSDNGAFLGEHGFASKWLMHEESIRVPLAIFDPRLPAEFRGKTSPRMALNLDIGPTLLDLAGVEIPASMQGRSLVPLLRNPTADFRKDWFYEHHFTLPEPNRIAKSEGVRTERWKFVRYLDEDPPAEQLFDLQDDPLETNDLAHDPDFARQLLALRTRWLFYAVGAH